MKMDAMRELSVLIKNAFPLLAFLLSGTVCCSSGTFCFVGDHVCGKAAGTVGANPHRKQVHPA